MKSFMKHSALFCLLSENLTGESFLLAPLWQVATVYNHLNNAQCGHFPIDFPLEFYKCKRMLKCIGPKIVVHHIQKCFTWSKILWTSFISSTSSSNFYWYQTTENHRQSMKCKGLWKIYDESCIVISLIKTFSKFFERSNSSSFCLYLD